MKDIGWIMVFGVICVLFFTLGGIIGSTIAAGDSYTGGYCAALNGTALNGEACNVDGRVVEVKR